jgi:hypothetical protein
MRGGEMKLPLIGFAALICLGATPVFAHEYSGFLVDSKCFEAQERNVNPQDTEIYVNRDKDREIRYCSPNAKTKSFTLVDHDGLSFRLDTAGSMEAAEIIRKNGKKDVFRVTVTGEKIKDEIRATAVSPAK